MNKIPGFRSGTLWKKIVAVIGYVVLLILLIQGQWIVLLPFIAILIPVTNLFGLRNKFYLFNRRSVIGKVLGYAVYGLALIMMMGIISTPKTPTMTVNADKPIVKVEDKVVQDDTSKKAEDDKKKQEEEAKAKVDADAKAKADEEAKSKAEQELKVKQESEAKVKAEEEAKKVAVVNTPPPQQTEQQQQNVTTTPPPATEVYYKNCTEVKAAGVAPLYKGQPGYRSSLDRDGDGCACEK